ncbi:hypothetical protein BH23PLA1_BH23PLA1_12910 [soil metagenome]
MPDPLERALAPAPDGLSAQIDEERRAAALLPRIIADRDASINDLFALLQARDRRIVELNDRLTERGLAVTWYDSEVRRRDDVIGRLLAETNDQARTLDTLSAELAEIRESTTWKLGRALLPIGSRRQRLLGRGLRGWKALKRKTLARRSRPNAPSLSPTPNIEAPEPPAIAESPEENIIEPFKIPRPVDPYQQYRHNNRWNDRAHRQAESALDNLPRRPLVSIVMACDLGEEDSLASTIKSFQKQVYPHWELCVARRGQTLRQPSPIDPRLRVVNVIEGEEPGNTAAAIAQGEFLLLLEPGDELEPDALLEIVHEWTSADPFSPDILYCDDDLIGVDGQHQDPRFKPSWSPEYLLSCLYFGRSFCVRRVRFEAIGGFRAGFEGARNYDIALRLTESEAKIVHVPRVLLHLRGDRTVPQAGAWAVRALQEALNRRGIEGRACQSDLAIQERLDFYQIDFPDDGPPVSILIPTKDRVDLLRRCIDSIQDRTNYRNYEIVVIDNDSTDPETLAYLDALGAPCRVERISNNGGKFSYARIHNRAVDRLGEDREFVLFLNNDVEIRRPEWLSQLVGYARIEGVGTVGARLLYPDGRVQHAGVLTGRYGGMPGHAFKLAPWWDAGPLHSAVVARNYSAVTAACLLTRRELFQKLGGFDAKRFSIAYNDVDYCLRVHAEGLRTVYAPRAELFHFEGATRGFDDDPTEASAYRAAWGRRIDLYDNPNLTTHDERFTVNTRRALARSGQGNRPLQALLWGPDLDHSDASALLVDLARGLQACGRVVPEIVTTRAGATSRRLQERGISIQQRTLNASDLAAWMIAKGFDVVLAVTLGGQVAIEAARLAGLPALWTIQEPIDPMTDLRRGSGAEQLASLSKALAHPYRIIFHSWAVRRIFQPLDSLRSFSTVPVSIDLSPIDLHLAEFSKEQSAKAIGAAKTRRIVAVVGSATHPAGLRDAALAILALPHADRLDTRYLLIGGDQDEQVCELARRCDSIQPLPERIDRFHLLNAADLVVCGLYHEGYPRATLEAMGFGKPIVTTTEHGLDEQVRHEVNALTYCPGDVSTLADHLSRLMDDEIERLRLRRNARAFVEHLPSFEEMIRDYEQLCLEAQAAGPPGERIQTPRPIRRDVA